MKKTLAIFIAVVMLVSCISTAAVSAATDPTIQLNGKTYTAKSGSEITYTVNMTTPEKIENGQFIIYYPSSVLTVKEVNFDTALLGNPMVNYTEGVTDEIDFNFSDIKGYDFTTKHKLVEVKFTVTGAGSGEISLSKKSDELVICNLNDEDIEDKVTFEETVSGVTTPTVKKSNTLTVKAATKSVKAKNLKKKAQTVKKAFTISKAKGTVTVAKVKKGTTSKIYKKVTVKKNGSIKIKKGKYAKKTYKVVIKVTAKGNASYKSKTVTKTVKIKVK